MAAAKKAENALEDVSLEAGKQQNSSNQYSLDIYGRLSREVGQQGRWAR
jgi:hypothetical protein